MKQFDEKTIQGLNYYVYLLIDPQNQTPFYVGKGKGNRLFDHVNCCIKDESSESLKYNEIRRIGASQVDYMILRHDLKEGEAYHLESATIDLLKYMDTKLTNISSGHNSIEKGLMRAEDVQRIYNAESLDEMDSDCIIININKSYKRWSNNNSIYNATKGVWAMDYNKAKQIKYVLSAYRGLIVEVFEVEEWLQEKRYYSSSTKKHGNCKRMGCAFRGKIANDAVRNKYIGKSITAKIKKGAANPIKYTL